MPDAAVDFGTRMKRAREARGISLRQIAAATRISVAALEALERNDISRLPGGIFSRAFVRSYAVEVGLDPEEAVRQFIAQFPHESVTAGSPHVPQEDHAAIESERESAATAVKLLAISIPLAGAILYFTLRNGRPEPHDPAPPAGMLAQDTAPAGALVFELTATAPLTLDVAVDGEGRPAGDIRAGERLVFEANREIVLTVSDAASLRLTINGQPAVPLGGAGERRTVHISRENLGSLLAAR